MPFLVHFLDFWPFIATGNSSWHPHQSEPFGAADKLIASQYAVLPVYLTLRCYAPSGTWTQLDPDSIRVHGEAELNEMQLNAAPLLFVSAWHLFLHKKFFEFLIYRPKKKRKTDFFVFCFHYC